MEKVTIYVCMNAIGEWCSHEDRKECIEKFTYIYGNRDPFEVFEIESELPKPSKTIKAIGKIV